MNAKIAGAVAVVAVTGLAVGLLGTDGEPEAVREPALAAVPSQTPASPRESEPQPRISAKPVTAAPAPTTATATAAPTTPAPIRTKTTTPAAPPPTTPAPPPPPAPHPLVPNVVGMPVDQAAGTLSAAGYGHKVVCQEGRATGRVASQQPAGGQQWSPGGEVALFVPFWRCRDDRPDRPWDDD
ncbi:PASTA domain-containing protein [Actinocorallia populi]|uniref:PASTA domain-containing protein n=1 Tax=Actinocorallia populi TaxID=2079200 RepID=UPI000D088ABE|nr:PASTA domain-containing protein [Actinocorallia populi]